MNRHEFRIIYLEMLKIISNGNTISVTRSILSCEYFIELEAVQFGNHNEFILLINSYKIKDFQISTSAELTTFMEKIHEYKTSVYSVNKMIKTLNLESVIEQQRKYACEKFIDYI